ncbi:MAG TPA: DUF2892 domain-containing protein [Deltaproteobacteria bacterium]|nr:DUF2892 domain-containing protein [Deltaproteobacteria bacterium]HPR53374.1 DUF2892 domain-containing protein [Deltaproteobacteria bacterium]
MEPNVGFLDRISRLIVAVALIVFLLKSSKVSFFTVVALVTSGALIASAASGYCALYTHLGISTSDKI